MDFENALAAMEVMQGNMEVIKKQTELNAVLMRVAYDSLLKTGFTEEQAIEIIKSKGGMLS